MPLIKLLHASIAEAAVVAMAASDLQVGWIPTYLDPVPPLGRSKGVNLS